MEGYEPQPLPRPLPDILVVEGLIPDIERPMFPADSDYVEACYLPILGPTSTWLYRRLAMMLACEQHLELESVGLAQELGIGHGTAPTSPLWRSIHRLKTFDICFWVADRLLVPMALPPLSVRQRSRLTTRVLSWEQKLRQAEDQA